MCKGSWKFVLFCVLACGCAASGAEETPRRYYNHATELTLREAPAADAAARLRVPINQPLFLLARENSNWCKVKLADAAASGPENSGQAEGYVGCAFLQGKPLDFATIETEAARLLLALNQPGLGPADEARLLDRLFTQIERHFALSPSLYAYNDYRVLLEAARQYGSENPEFRLQAREKKREAMWLGLSRQTWEKAFPAVRWAVATSRLKKNLWKQKLEGGNDKIFYYIPEYTPPGTWFPSEGAYHYNEISTSSTDESGPPEHLPEPDLKASFFSQGKWAIGWAGGPMIRRLHGSHPPVYLAKLSIGGNESLLNNLHEMVKAHKAPVRVSQVTVATPNMDVDNAEVLTLETKLPVWAITADGLVAGELRKARFGPDDSACAYSPGSAEFVFARPLKGRIYGIFASNAPIDPAKVKVTVRDKVFLLGYILGKELARLHHDEEASVDIDGDGVIDLRVLLSTEEQIANLEQARPRHALFTGNHGGFLHVNGEYGQYTYNAYSLQVNENGRWRRLYLYNPETCT